MREKIRRAEDIIYEINPDYFSCKNSVSASNFCDVLERFEGCQTSYQLDIYLRTIKKNIRNEANFLENIGEFFVNNEYTGKLDESDDLVPTAEKIDKLLNRLKEVYYGVTKTIVVPPFLVNYIVDFNVLHRNLDDLYTLINPINEESKTRSRECLNMDFINVRDEVKKEIIYLCKNDKISELLTILSYYYHIFFVSIKNGKSILHYLAKYGSVSNLFCLLYLSNGYVDILDDNLNLPTFMAIRGGKIHNLISLLLMGSNVHHKNIYNMNLLTYAILYEKPQMVFILLKLNIDANIQDTVLKYTPIMYSMFVSRCPLVTKMLLEYGVDLSIRDADGNNALHLAVIKNMMDNVILLSKYECYPNHKNKCGETPLYIATQNNNVEMVKFLLKIGADPSIPNNNYLFPINISKNKKCKLILRDLLANRSKNTSTPLLQLRDITGGAEKKPVPLINYIDNLPPPNFVYIRQNIYPDHIRIRNDMTCCNCTGDCMLSDFCYCRNLCYQKKIWYDNKRLTEINNIKIIDRPLIYECNDKCTCNHNCSTRVVQYGVQVSMKLIKTKNIGYSLVVDEDVPVGTFIVEYVGKICSNSEANTKKNDDYLHDIDTVEEGDQFCIDSYQYGNVSRFINHNCNPNLESFRVFFDHHDMRLPHICYFAKRRIKKGEALSMSYGETFWKKKPFGCLCGYEYCYYKKNTV